MRKADYAHLARCIADEIRLTRHTVDEKARALTREALENVAREFARHASVNAREFLEACGLTP